MNSLFAAFGIESWKPVLASLLLPPVPFLALVLAGAALLSAGRRRSGWPLTLIGIAGIWLSACIGTAAWLQRVAFDLPPPLSAQQVAELRQRVQRGEPLAIVVLGGGRVAHAAEYGRPNLSGLAIGRLRYALWLARQTGAPVAYSGGIGWAQRQQGDSEAEMAARMARDEFGVPLRWAESESRDTRENAARTVELMRRDGIREVVLVSNAWHLPRGLRAFRDAAGDTLRLTPAPIGTGGGSDRSVLRWLPTRTGFAEVNYAGHELIGLLAGS